MAFPLRKNRPGRYWKGRINFATALAETAERNSEERQPAAVGIAEPAAGDELRSIADRVLGLGRAAGDSPGSPILVEEIPADGSTVAGEGTAYRAAFEETEPGGRAVAAEAPAYRAAFEELVTMRPVAGEPGSNARLGDGEPSEPHAIDTRPVIQTPEAQAPVANAAMAVREEPARPAEERKVVEATRPLPAIEPPVARPRAVGAPLPRGKASPPSVFELRAPERRSLPSPAPAAPVRNEAEEEHPTGGQRAAKVFRAAVPFLQRLMPLLDGNIVGAVTNILAPPHKPSAPLDLGPVHDALTELQVQHRELRDQVAEQNITIGRVEDQLERVREATDRNTLEQQELMEDLRAVGFKANVIALVALAMLLIAVFLDLFLYLRFQRVFP